MSARSQYNDVLMLFVQSQESVLLVCLMELLGQEKKKYWNSD